MVRLIGLQRIAANDLCKPIRAMRRRAPNRAHLIELHPVTEPSNLPGCLGTGKASADDSDLIVHANSLRHEKFQGVANESLKVFAMDYGIEHSVL